MKQFLKLSKRSDGYKKGLRYIDFGKNQSSKIRFLKRKPIKLKGAKKL